MYALRAARFRPRTPVLAAAISLVVLMGPSIRVAAPDLTLGPVGARSAAVPATGAISTIAVIGDFGTADAAEASVATLVASWSPAAVIGAGDDYYPTAGGTGLGRYDLTIGQYYCAFLKGAAGGPSCPSGGTADTNRFWSSTGNHEYSDGGIANYTGYLPFPGNERYYSVRIGSVEVFFLDSDEALRTPSDMAAQKAWLESAARASTAPWQVVVFHHPPYSSGATQGSTSAMRWPFAAWGIDLVVNGHDHDYERVAADGITYVVDGLGGATTYGFGTPIAGSLVRYNANHGALRLDASDASLSGSFVSVDGVIRDTFSVAPVVPTVSWSGQTWSVKTSATPVGPGPNVFSASNAWVDGSGYLHLRIAQDSTGTWTTGEIVGPTSQGYGTYTFTLGSRVDNLDPNAVLGLFTWSDSAAYANREIDIEASRWGDGADPTNAQYVVQPDNVAGHLQRFTEPAATVSTQTFTWSPGRVSWESRDATGALVASYTYSGSDVPVPGDERVHLNLWLFRGAAPVAAQPVEVVVRSFAFTPGTTPAPGAFSKSSPKTATKVTAGNVNLAWAASSNATAYQYCISRTTGTCTTWIATTARNATVAVPAKGLTWYWQVRAIRGSATTDANAGTWWRFTTK